MRKREKISHEESGLFFYEKNSFIQMEGRRSCDRLHDLLYVFFQLPGTSHGSSDTYAADAGGL